MSEYNFFKIEAQKFVEEKLKTYLDYYKVDLLTSIEARLAQESLSTASSMYAAEFKLKEAVEYIKFLENKVAELEKKK